jgi:predicted metal-dependent phosphoesterase TrpH
MERKARSKSVSSEPRPGLLRIDMHVHSSYSGDAILPAKVLFRSWMRTGIVPLICDHDTIEGSVRVMRAIHAEDPDIPLILSEEITTRDGEVIGLFLTGEIPPGLSAAETLDLIHGQGGLALVPHPFSNRRTRVLRAGARNALVDRIDLVEGYNARNIRDDEDRFSVVFASEMGIPFTAGSDAHTSLELGRVWMEVPPFDGPPGLLRGLAEAPFTFRRMNRGIHLISRVVKGIRKTMD